MLEYKSKVLRSLGLEQLEEMLKGWLKQKNNDIIKPLVNMDEEYGILHEIEKVLKAHSIPDELRENSIGPESLSVQRTSPTKQYE